MKLIFWAIVLLSVAAGLGGSLYRWVKSRSLPDVTDEEFLRGLSGYEHLDRDTLLQERRRVGRILGSPAIKLSPCQELSALAKRFEYLGQFSVAWTDLDDEIHDYQASGRDTETARLPETIGELVGELAAGRVYLPSEHD